MERRVATFVLAAFLAGLVVGYFPVALEIRSLRGDVQFVQGQVEVLQKEIVKLEKHFITPENASKIAEKMRVVVVEEGKNRTLVLNPTEWYCKVIVFCGGSDPIPWDLAYPNASITFFFLEDIEGPERADNYSDLIIRMNPIIDRDGKLKMVVVFFAEGAYEKLVYYNEELLHHYQDDDPTSNYGIRLLPIDPT